MKAGFKIEDRFDSTSMRGRILTIDECKACLKTRLGLNDVE
jgi:hypothetical protein